ncbi:MAG: hypothetical protein FD153_422, partial [Rhodospirillaceae bacterium]
RRSARFTHPEELPSFWRQILSIRPRVALASLAEKAVIAPGTLVA